MRRKKSINSLQKYFFYIGYMNMSHDCNLEKKEDYRDIQIEFMLLYWIHEYFT